MGGIFGIAVTNRNKISRNFVVNIEDSIKLVRHRGDFRYRLFTNRLVWSTNSFDSIKEQIIEVSNTTFAIFNSLSQEEYDYVKSISYPIAFDGEIYRYKEKDIASLAEEINTKEEENSIFSIKEFIQNTDGVWSTAIYGKERIYLFRDLLGVKPLWYAFSDRFFVFSSERKAIWRLGLKAYPVIPRDVISYDLKRNKLHNYRSLVQFTHPETFENNENEIKETILQLMKNAIKKRVKKKHIAVLFSGGVDSTFLSQLAKTLGYKVYGYCLKIGDSKDYRISKELASQIEIELRVVDLEEMAIKENIENIIKVIEDYNPIRVSVASALYPVMKRIRDDGYRTAISGNGAEEIFIGYRKYQDLLDYGKRAVTEATIKGIENIWVRDIYRDDLISAHLGLNTKLPFLDINVVKYSLKVEPTLKVNKKWKKLILRELAEEIGVPKDTAWRKKLAAQYGTGVMKTITKISKSKGYKYLVDYFYDTFRNIYQSML